MVTKVDTKTFVGKNIIHVAVFKKKDKRTYLQYDLSRRKKRQLLM